MAISRCVSEYDARSESKAKVQERQGEFSNTKEAMISEYSRGTSIRHTENGKHERKGFIYVSYSESLLNFMNLFHTLSKPQDHDMEQL